MLLGMWTRNRSWIRRQAAIELAVGVVAGLLAAVFGLVRHKLAAAVYLSVIALLPLALAAAFAWRLRNTRTS